MLHYGGAYMCICSPITQICLFGSIKIGARNAQPNASLKCHNISVQSVDSGYQ